MRLASFLGLGILVVAGPALAQDAPAGGEPTGEAVAPDGMDAEAHALYSAGEVAFGEGRFENALDYFRRAYDLSHRPELLYNVGTTADRLRRDQEALTAFEQYLAELPTATNRGEVESRIAVLRAAVASAAERDAARDAPDVSEDDGEGPPARIEPVRDEGPGAGPWIVLGIGAAVAVGGGVLVGLAAADVASVENAPPMSSWASVRDAYGRSEAESIAGAVMLGVGGVAMIGGLVWGVIPSGGASADRASVEIAPTPGGLVVRGSF